MSRPFFIITGHGRSGTNLALSLLDAHPRTRCRNEPNEIAGASLSFLNHSLFMSAPDALKADPGLLPRACGYSGSRDQKISPAKSYVRRKLPFLAAREILHRDRVRRPLLNTLGRACPDEWAYPRVLMDDAGTDGSVPVLKILLASTWIAENQSLDARQHVIHVRREPRGFLQSWYNRYVMGSRGVPQERIFQESKAGFSSICDYFGTDPARYDAFSLENLVEVELWRWRYVNALLEDRLGGSDRYLRIEYDQLIRNQLAAVETLYEFVGLDLDGETQASIAGAENTLFSNKHRWKLEDDMLDGCIDRVMGAK